MARRSGGPKVTYCDNFATFLVIDEPSTSTFNAEEKDYRADNRPGVVKCDCKNAATEEAEVSPWTAIGLHGFGQAQEAKTRPKRIAWAALVTTGVIVSILTTNTTFRAYIENESATLITISQRPQLRMPTLYICPKNPDALNSTLVRQDILKYLPNIDENNTRLLVAFAIAGAGFHNMEPMVRRLSDDDISRLSVFLHRWRGNRTYDGFMRTLFETNGYKCNELFDRCYYGKHPLSCCDIFESTFVMLRGRCFRLKKFYQHDPDLYGRLLITLKNLTSWFIEKNGIQPQVVAYLSHAYGEASTFPRYYFNANTWFQLSLKLRQIKMLDTNPQCASDCANCDLSRCYVKKWLTSKVMNPLNCTLFYEQHNAPEGMRVCDPEVIIRNYDSVVDTSMNGTKCLPACDREDFTITLMNLASDDDTTNDDVIQDNPPYRLELFFNALEVEKYLEVATTTASGFVSELGGQSNLFLGCSIITVIQGTRAILLLIHHYFKVLRAKGFCLCCGQKFG